MERKLFTCNVEKHKRIASNIKKGFDTISINSNYYYEVQFPQKGIGETFNGTRVRVSGSEINKKLFRKSKAKRSNKERRNVAVMAKA